MSNIVKGSGIIYTTGVPNTIPNQGTDAEFAIDINGNQYAWNRTNTVWDNMGQAIEIATSSAAPTHTPSNFRPRFLMTPSRELYFYSGSWGKIGSLPSGLFSSSGQIGPTGIYSGSGIVPNGTSALSLFEDDPTRQIRYLFSLPGLYQQLSDGFNQTGIESVDLGTEDYSFAGFQGDGDHAAYRIQSSNLITNNYSLFYLSSNGCRIGSSGAVILDNYSGSSTFEFTLENAQGKVKSTNGLGLMYLGNYTSSFATSSLIDRRYADKHIAFSSSAAATSASLITGRGGIYNGSGIVPPMTMAKVNYSSDAGQTGSLLFSEYSDYDILKGYDIRRFGLSHNMTGSAYGFGGFVSTSGSTFQILSSVSQSITQECKFEVSPQKITFYSESGSNNRGTIEFNSNDGLKYLTVPPPLTKYSFVHKDYVDTAINSRPLTIPALSGSKGNFESTVSFSTSNKRILVYGITLTELIVNVQPESYLDGTDFELIFIASVVNTLTIQFDLGSTTVPISNITGFHTVKYIFTYFQPSNIWIITDYVAIA